MSPGVQTGAPGLRTVMKNEKPSERAAALINEALDVMQRVGKAPDSPIDRFLTAKQRREFRRAAARLRQHKAEPRYGNLHSAEQLADIYERTIQRDEIREQAQRDFKKISFDLARVMQENATDPEVAKTIATLWMDAKRLAEEQGPGSEAAQRYGQLQYLRWLGQRYYTQKRRGRVPAPPPVPLTSDPFVGLRYVLTAAEHLLSPPTSEPVIAIPPEDSDSGRERVLLRIGLGKMSWIGSFECGHASVSTICMMPGDRHIFVSAQGAGYIIDAKSRTLVEQIGTEVIGVMLDPTGTLFLVDHNGRCLEAFGKNGRLWKTNDIGSEEFRRMTITDDELTGEAWHSLALQWIRFSVNLATGEVTRCRFIESLRYRQFIK